ncbi:YveK family protein [Arsenicicoccus sp. oral taxon 190]|uniref:YveK family protein n=1 Tax=Arsenicicoccus sp. oral taxon 190 TaxID=1658671 RepID=UPI00067A419F|nr:hypothetical protein [Arsenicicoccus sp. oral taxon 190]AKT50531.1 hypothetical protein ADJ73_02980 [Arsenicicoccus sp. oral taxon 190]
MPEVQYVDHRFAPGIAREALRRNLGWLLLSAALGAALGWLTHSLHATTYASDVRTSVRFVATSSTAQPPSADVLQGRVLSYKDLAGSDEIAAKVRGQLRTSRSNDDLLRSMSFTAPTGTSDIVIHAVSSDQEQARRLADAWARQLTTKVAEVEKLAVSPGGFIRLVPISPPSTPVAEDGLGAAAHIALGAGLGLIGMVGVLLLGTLLRPRVYSAGQLRDVVGAPVLTALPHLPELDGAAPGTSCADRQLQEARSLLAGRLRDGARPVLLVLPVRPGSGSSTVARWLLADRLDDGDDAHLLELSGGVGGADERAVIAGRAPARTLVVDAPSASASALAQSLVTDVDAVVLVVDARRARLKDVQDAVARLVDAGAPGVGLVVNHIGRTRRAARAYEVPWPERATSRG